MKHLFDHWNMFFLEQNNISLLKYIDQVERNARIPVVCPRPTLKRGHFTRLFFNEMPIYVLVFRVLSDLPRIVVWSFCFLRVNYVYIHPWLEMNKRINKKFYLLHNLECWTMHRVVEEVSCRLCIVELLL